MRNGPDEPLQAPSTTKGCNVIRSMHFFFYLVSTLHARTLSIFMGFSLTARKIPIRVLRTDLAVQMMKIRCFGCVGEKYLVLYDDAQYEIGTNSAKSKCTLH